MNFEGCQTCLSYAESFLKDFVIKEKVFNNEELKIILTGYPSKKWLSIKIPGILKINNIYFDKIGIHKSYSFNLSYPLAYTTSAKKFIEVRSDKIATYETLKVILSQ